jgi:hypothetical protein
MGKYHPAMPALLHTHNALITLTEEHSLRKRVCIGLWSPPPSIYENRPERSLNTPCVAEKGVALCRSDDRLMFVKTAHSPLCTFTRPPLR